MPFAFPDPQTTPEFTGDNGITYIWDADDSKWQIKGFAVEQGEDFDPQLKEHVCAEFFEVVADYSTVQAKQGHSMATYDFGGDQGVKYWTKPPKADFFVNGESYYIDEAGPFEISQLDVSNQWVTFFIKDGPEPAVGEFCTFSKTRKLCTEVAFLQNEIVELEEEIDAIAPSVERGKWRFTAVGTVANRGQFTMYDSEFGTGQPTGLFTSVKSIWFNAVDIDGVTHSFGDVDDGELLEVFVDNSPEYGLYEVVGKAHDETQGASSFWVIDVNFVRTNEATAVVAPGETCRFKVFMAPTGGDVSSFVMKTGDTMEGPGPLVFKTKATSSSYNNPPTNTSYLKFVNDKNGSITSGSLWFGGNINILTTDLGLMVRGAIYTKEYYYAYGTSGTNYPRIRLQSSTGSLQSSSTVALAWDSTGVTKIRAKDSEGSSGYVLRLDSSKKPYWSSPPMPTYTITKSNGNYYVS